MDFALCARGNLIPEEAIALTDSGNYVMETKVDGVRARITRTANQIRIYTRNGELDPYRFGNVFDAIRGIAIVPGKKLILDGELGSPDLKFTTVQRAIASKTRDTCNEIVFYAFDVLSYAEDDTYRFSYSLRHTILHNIGKNSGLFYIQNNEDMQYSGKEFLTLVKNFRREGVVVKQKDALYLPGYSRTWQRCKFTDTISAFPLDVRDDLMVECGLLTNDPNLHVYIGAVKVPEDDLLLLLNDKDATVVLELEAYGVDDNRKLRHPVYKGLRFDVDYQACTSDQLDRLRSY